MIRNYFPKHTSGAPLNTLSKFYDVPFGFLAPSNHFRQCIALFSIAKVWMLLDIG